MEKVEGKDLFTTNVEGRTTIGINGAKLAAQQTCLAVSALHRKNILHRDIKSENILVDEENGSYKLIDFGLSVRLKKAKQQNGLQVQSSVCHQNLSVLATLQTVPMT